MESFEQVQPATFFPQTNISSEMSSLKRSSLDPDALDHNRGQADLPKPQRPKKNKVLVKILVVLILILVAVGVYAIVKHSNKTTTKTAAPTTSNAPAQVSITSTGFVPKTLTIKPNQAVIWTNNDSKQHEVASDPYPTDNTVPGLDDPQPMAKTDTFSYIFPYAGVYTYHDNLNPYTFHGTIVVR